MTYARPVSLAHRSTVSHRHTGPIDSFQSGSGKIPRNRHWWTVFFSTPRRSEISLVETRSVAEIRIKGSDERTNDEPVSTSTFGKPSYGQTDIPVAPNRYYARHPSWSTPERSLGCEPCLNGAANFPYPISHLHNPTSRRSNHCVHGRPRCYALLAELLARLLGADFHRRASGIVPVAASYGPAYGHVSPRNPLRDHGHGFSPDITYGELPAPCLHRLGGLCSFFRLNPSPGPPVSPGSWVAWPLFPGRGLSLSQSDRCSMAYDSEPVKTFSTIILAGEEPEMNTAVREKWISLINVGWVAQCEICKVVVAFGRTKNQVDLAAGRHLEREHPSLTVEGEA